MFNLKFILLKILLISFVSSTIGLKRSSITKTYEKGVQAYSSERWSECIVQFEESLHLYKLYKSVIISCRLKCNTEHYEPVMKTNVEDLKVYERFFNIRNCLNKCLDIGFEHSHLEKSIEDSTLSYMQKRKPYEYLHMCYFQMNLLPKAASAVLTNLVANPNDAIMQENLRFYLGRPQVDPKVVVDLLSEDYEVMHKLGLEAYEKKNWAETVASMEEVIQDYTSWENSCRVECEYQPEQEWSPEFSITMSNHMASILNCRQQCQDKLKPLGYSTGTEFLADILNYLQISYYKLDRVNDAAKAVKSYLSIMPNDEDMLENANIYSTLTTGDAFVERSDISHYSLRDKYERKLLNIFHQGSSHDTSDNAL